MGTESKLVQVSRDGIDYFTLPGSTAEISRDGAELDNSIFGQKFGSTFTGIIDWSISGNAWLRQQAGYEVSLKRAGDPVAFSDEPMAVESGLKYRIVDEDKSFWDYEEDIVVSDDGSTVDAEDILEIDHLMGRVTFVAGYTVSGPITVSGDYKPVTEFANANSMTLTQSAATIEAGSFETVKANNGFQNYVATLLTASLDLEGFYREDNDFYAILNGREDILVEIDFAGDGETLARGVFKVSSDNQSGDVGGNEVESVSLSLSVPEDVLPFSWYFGPLSTAPEGFQVILEGWLNRTNVYVRYFPRGATNLGFGGQVVVTDASITAAVDSMVEMSFDGQGDGILAAINESTA
jgi:hypothetical protein